MRESIKHLKPYNPGKSLELLEAEIGKTLIKLSANENLWGPSPSVQYYLQNKLPDLHLYPDGLALELKTELAKKWRLASDNFTIGNGTDEIIFMLTTAFLNPNERVLIPAPTFSEYAASVTINGGNTEYIYHDSLVFDPDLIIAKTSNNTKILFVCNPNNPTGTYLTHQEIEHIMRSIPKETLVVLDEAYCHFATANDFPRSTELLTEYKNLMVLRTFSKAYGIAAFRVGYAAADSNIIKSLEKVRPPFNVNTLGQGAALAALKDREYLQKTITMTAKQREYLINGLESLGFKVLPSQTNFVLAQIENASRLAEQLLLEGILVRYTGPFGIHNGLRITVAPPIETDYLLKALNKCIHTK